MENYYNEEVGSEATLPSEIIDFIHQHKNTATGKQRYQLIDHIQSHLDDYELAMVA